MMHSVVAPHGDGFAIGTTYAEYQSGKVVNQIVKEFDGFLGKLVELLYRSDDRTYYVIQS